MALTEERKKEIQEEEQLRAEIQSKQKPKRGFFSNLCKWTAILWTVFLFICFVMSTPEVAKLSEENPGMEGAVGVGIMGGMFIYSIIWLIVAVPASILSIITKKR